MKQILTIFIFVFFVAKVNSQTIYFPPLVGETWESIAPESIGWCPQKVTELYDFLDQENTKAFIVLKDGRIVLEKYFSTFTKDSSWYWASAGKTMTAFLVGIAQQEKQLSILDLSSQHMGKGWTNCLSTEEDKITIRHQLTMTSGLDDGVSDHHCTLRSCLTCITSPGDRWAYHNGPYTLLDSVIQKATGQTLNGYVNQKLKISTGMTGAFFKIDYDNVFISKARSMARFGLLLLNKGEWNGKKVLSDTAYFRQMTNTSQTINPAYGYLTWLNGKSSFKVPLSQISFPGPLASNAPSDMYAAIGKNGQFINVVPSQNLVMIRMGNAPDGSEVPFLFNNDIWARLKDMTCSPTSILNALNAADINLSYNPEINALTVNTTIENYSLLITDLSGKVVVQKQHCFSATVVSTLFPQGVYLVQLTTKEGRILHKKLTIL